MDYFSLLGTIERDPGGLAIYMKHHSRLGSPPGRLESGPVSINNAGQIYSLALIEWVLQDERQTEEMVRKILKYKPWIP